MNFSVKELRKMESNFTVECSVSSESRDLIQARNFTVFCVLSVFLIDYIHLTQRLKV